MSDVPQGDGWWLASDGKYYPPEQHPDAVRQPPPLPPPVPPTPPAPTVPTMPAVPPAVPPTAWTSPPAGSPAVGPPAAWTSPPTGPPTVGSPSLGAAGAWGSTATAMATAQIPSSPEPWYRAWWAIALGLLFCFPVGLVLLWTSRKPMGAKVGLSIATALLVVVAMISSGTSSRTQDDIAATAGERDRPSTSERVETKVSTTTTTEPPTTTAPPTTPPPPPPTTAAPPPPPPAPPPTAPPTTADPFASESVSQRNARRSAAQYLEVSAFSRTGLIEQLEFEGFSNADATYGVDAQFADWNQQAAASAAQYLEVSAFSRSGLYDQLIFEGFTPSEAEYGVSTTGL
jgi:hypothetical protein